MRVAIPNKDIKPTISVIVVNITPPARAGSIFNLAKIKGRLTPLNVLARSAIEGHDNDRCAELLKAAGAHCFRRDTNCIYEYGFYFTSEFNIDYERRERRDDDKQKDENWEAILKVLRKWGCPLFSINK